MTNKDQIINGRTPATSFPVVYFAPDCKSTESNAISEDPTNRSGNELKNVCKVPQHESIKIKTLDVEFGRPLENPLTIALIVDGADVGSVIIPSMTSAVTHNFGIVVGGDSLYTYRYTGGAPESVLATVVENSLK